MNKILDLILTNVPGLDMLNGYKVMIGRILAFVGAVLLIAHQQFPEIPNLDQYYNSIMVILGWSIFKIGQKHDKIKEGRD